MEEGICKPHSHFISRKGLLLWTLLLLFLQSSTCNGQCSNNAGCFPPVENLALGRTVDSASTCSSGSLFCIFGSPSADCFPCNPNTTHSISNINDNNNGSVWLSEIGPSSSNTTLQLDFEAPILFERTVLVWQSARPRSMVLERSHDNGETWIPYRYYSASCNDSFMLPNTVVTSDTVLSSTEAICTNVESQLFPVTNALVTFSTSQHLPNSTPPDTVLAYTQITNLRVRFISMFESVRLAGTMYQYFAVSEWNVEGTCMCNGHASRCAPAPGEAIAQDKVYAGCMCQHNTAGVHCDQCATGFNNVSWAPGTDAEANICQECMCNDHAADCQYNVSSMSALCINCTDNTMGDMCEQCLPQFYQDPTLLLDNPDICRVCDCNPAGMNDSGLCNALGQCNCKANVNPNSRQCTECADGFWNLTSGNPLGCQECDCNPNGAIESNGRPLCNKTTGQCDCRENVRGDRCSECMPGFYDVSRGCLPCGCNLGGSESTICNQNTVDAQCPCKPNIDSITCTAPLPGYFFRPLDFILFEAEEAELSQGSTTVYPVSGQPFTGRGLVSLPDRGTARFVVQVLQDSQYELIIRYLTTTQVDGVTLRVYSLDPVTLDLNCVPINGTVFRHLGPETLVPDQRHHQIDSVCLSSVARYEIVVEYNTFTAAINWLLDSLLLLPDFSVPTVSTFYSSQSPQKQRDIIEPCLPREATNSPSSVCQDVSFTLSTEFFGQVFACDCNMTGSVNASNCTIFGGACDCQPGVTGRQCDSCQSGWFNFSVGRCEACNCHQEGSISPVCDFVTGQCTCKTGTGERTCSECLPGYFNLTSGGCSPCQCSQYALSNECDSSGQCTCPSGVGGLKCDECLDSFYNISANGCLPCNCNILGSASGRCNITNGQCSCVENTIGRTCSECPVGYFMTDGINRDRCIECTCSGRSDMCVVDSENYALGAVQSEFTTLCTQNSTSCSDGWQLLTASGQLAAPFGPSDASGLGYILLVNDEPQLFASQRFLGDRQASYGLMFRVVAVITNTGTINRGTTFIRMTGSLLNQTLIGTFPYPVVTQNGNTVERFLTYSIPLIENNWRVGSSTGPTATLFQLLSVLSNITELSISAEFTDDFIEFVHIRDISFQVAIGRDEINTTSSDITLITAPFPVEQCTCPVGYTGQFCQECSRGHARPSADPADLCVQCNCNNLTLDCDARTGICLNCGGNSEGPNCERCMPGYYGDPMRGIPCLPCECPTQTNSFSHTCFLDTDGLPTCDNCAVGYTGRNCERCVNGYFGSPLMGRCTTCECNGNVDSALGPVCNTTTGQCLNCLNNTMGFECDLCMPGYFGDPAFGIPCRACQCNPNGTVGDCDPVSGTCTCQPLVTGEQCEQCEDEYWGLSQGLGCIPCNCCENGSISRVCNKDTGRCDCRSNVGSMVDDKCCTCTPGFFNLSHIAGCQACNCSNLAVSAECDIVTGRCQCQPGAIGLKCDDCAFGFTGRVPNCEPCHECFQQWYDIISEVADTASILRSRIRILITANYDGHTVASIESQISSLLVQLENANQTLSNITLQTSNIADLEQTLSELNATLASLANAVAVVEQDLDMSQLMLDNVNAFDGSVNQTTIQDIQNATMNYSSTLTTLSAMANTFVAQLLRDQILVVNVSMVAESLNMTVETLLADISRSEADLNISASHVNEFRMNFNFLINNLTHLDMRTSSLLTNVRMLSELANNASMDVAATNNSVQNLLKEVRQRRANTSAVLVSARLLNNSVDAARVAAQRTLNSTNALMTLSEQTLMNASAILNSITPSITTVGNLTQQLNRAKALSLEILNISLPSLEYAMSLARQIDENMVSEEVVQEIIENATRSRMTAEEAMAIAQNASVEVMTAQLLVARVLDDLNCTTVSQQRVMETIPRVEQMVNQTGRVVQEVSDTFDDVTQTSVQAENMFMEASSTIQRANSVGMYNRQTASDLLNRTTNAATLSQQHLEGVTGDAARYSPLQSQVNTTTNEAANILQTAQGLQSQAERLNATANEVTLQELRDLLMEYMNEQRLVNELRSQVFTLQQELQTLTTSLTQAAERLQQCYKTP